MTIHAKWQAWPNQARRRAFRPSTRVDGRRRPSTSVDGRRRASRDGRRRPSTAVNGRRRAWCEWALSHQSRITVQCTLTHCNIQWIRSSSHSGSICGRILTLKGEWSKEAATQLPTSISTNSSQMKLGLHLTVVCTLSYK